MAKKMDWLYHTSGWLIIVGGLNWGLVGLFGFNLVDWLFGSGSFVSAAVYTLVGIAAVIYAWYKFKGE